MQLQWQFGGTYFASPDKLDLKVPFVKPEVSIGKPLRMPSWVVRCNRIGSWGTIRS